MDRTAEIYDGAVAALRRCCGPSGLMASGQPGGHRQIWARDSMIALLGARLVASPEIQAALRASISLLRQHQTPGGAIPNNVDIAANRPNFRAYADSGLWWIIGSAWVAPDPDGICAALRWYECQDVDQTGLLSMQESSDWEDLFCTRGKGLYLNCLFVLALRAAASALRLSHPEQTRHWLEHADLVAEKVNRWFWYRGDRDMLRHISHSFSTENLEIQDSLGRKRWIPEKRHLAGKEHYLPYLGFRAAGEWFDSLGNLLAILAGIADDRQSGIILDFLARDSFDKWPLRSLTPVVKPGDSDWREYYGSLNLPHHYHNGGVWPFIGGFYVAALVASGRLEAAAAALRSLGDLNLRGGFNEWHHGETGEPMGVRDQAWSAGMYLFALDCVRHGRVPLGRV